MINSAKTPQTIDQRVIDHYVAKGRRERSRMLAEMVRRLFTAPATTAKAGTAQQA